jgi:predicted ester cyclase
MRNHKLTVIYNWFDQVWNQIRKEAIDELATPDVIANGLGPEGRLQGIEAFKNFYDEFRSQFKNVNVVVEDVVSQDDMETGLCKVTATDTASGTDVEFSGLCMVRIVDGKIAEAWNQFDFLKMYQQLGFSLLPQEAVH